MYYSVLFEKLRAKKALKGNWQTALVIVFFASVFLTIQDVLEFSLLPSFSAHIYQASVDLNYDIVGQYLVSLAEVSTFTWTIYGIIAGLSFILSPALMMGANWYFIKRIQGEDIGIQGLFCRLPNWFAALRLTILMAVRIFLWSLLLFVPGIIAAIRYSMAPYLMAQDPTLTAREAIDKSKQIMKTHKWHYVLLLLSFVGWFFLSMIAQNVLSAFGVIVTLMGAQFLNLYIATYQNASLAAFFLTISTPEGTEKATSEIQQHMKHMGFTPPVKPTHIDEDDKE